MTETKSEQNNSEWKGQTTSEPFPIVTDDIRETY